MRNRWWAGVALVLVVLGCAKMRDEAGAPGPRSMAVDDSGSTPTESGGEALAGPRAGQRIVIKTGSISLFVTDGQAAMRAIGEILAKHGAFIAGRESQATIPHREVLSPSEVHSLRLMIKVPAEHFEALLADVKTVGSYTQEQTSIEDVTFQYVDLQARLENQKKVEKRLHAHLESAVEVKDIVAVEKELSRVREQIESLTAQFKVLQDQVALSTLQVDINVRPDWVPPAERTFWQDIAATTGESMWALWNTARLAVVYGIALAPWAVVLGLLGYGLVRVGRWRKWRRKS